eukprot:Phypoly_transcript_18121.p1 GENE.Phypoly_transcript_18121~~Phypoly_transcript_18121.p1  ORF type:complete len:239 (+),score=39.64 Phypoly_transcript_18121:60-719(+)
MTSAELAQYAVNSLPGAYYISNFFDPTQEEYYSKLCGTVRGSTKRGITRVNGPAVHAFVADNDEPQEMNYPKFICNMINDLKERKVLPEDPCQVSVNKYPKEYQMVPHKDGRGSQGAIVTFVSHAILDFYYLPEGKSSYTRVYVEEELAHIPPVRILMEPNSVLLLSGPSFVDYVHGIWQKEEDIVEKSLGNFSLLSKDKQEGQIFKRSERISLVFWNS